MVIIEHICNNNKKRNRDSLKALWNFSARPRRPSCCTYCQQAEQNPSKAFSDKQCCFIMSLLSIAGLFGSYKHPYLS